MNPPNTWHWILLAKRLSTILPLVFLMDITSNMFDSTGESAVFG